MKSSNSRRSILLYLNENYKLKVLYNSIRLMGKRKHVYLGFLGLSLAVITACIVIGPIMNKRVINAIEFANPSLFYSALFLMIFSTLLYWVVSPISVYAAAWASKRATLQIRSLLTKHLMSLPYTYYDTHSKGEALSYLSNDLDCLEAIYDGQLHTVWKDFCIGFTGLVMLFVIEWRLASVAMILGVGSILFSNRYSIPLGRIGARLQNNAEKTTTVFLDILKAIRTIKLFNLGALMGLRLTKTTNNETDCFIEQANKQAEMNVIVSTINGLSTFGILIIGAFMVQKGLTNWGSVIVVSTLQYATGDLFSLFPINLVRIQTSLAGVERLFNVLDESEESLNKKVYGFSSMHQNQVVLELKNVSFGYQQQPPILRNISFTLLKGEITVLIGENGGGKSTLAMLILGLYSPIDGQIILFGRKSELTLSSWRECFAYVPQNPQLLQGTIADNIAFDRVGVNADQIKSAAKEAGIHEFIESLPKKYETRLSEDGGNLSGGQKQRLAIARALIKKADILLLDEITSALDGENEASLMQTIRNLSEKHSILVIAHRKSILDYSDKLLKLESGTLTTSHLD